MNRFHTVAALLPEHHLDAVLLTGEANRFYTAGFFSTGTDGAALITAGQTYYFTDSRYTEAASKTIQNADIRETKTGKGYKECFQEIIAKHGIQRLGFEDAVMTVADYERYRDALSCELVPASKWLDKLRDVKDENEIENLIAAQRIAEGALEQILNEIRPGVTEKEIAAKLQYFMMLGGAEGLSFSTIVASGPNGSLPHAVPTNRKIQTGEFVTMDFGCIKNGYCSDMTRTVAVGSVTDEMRTVYNIVLNAQLSGIAAAKAGVSGKEVDAAARTVIQAAGYGDYFGHGFGHGVGVEIHETPTLSSRNEEPLPVGAVVSAEPGIYLPGRMGVRIEDVIVIQKDGCMDITQAPKELLVL